VSLSLGLTGMRPTVRGMAETTDGPPRIELLIRVPRGLPHPDLAECWHYRDLFFALVVRDLTVRYRHTLLGILWVIAQPLATMLVVALILGKFAHLPSDGVPYTLVAFCGLLPWMLCSRALGDGVRAMSSGSGLVTKIYFPRLFLPSVPIVSSLPDLGIMVLVLMVAMPITGQAYSFRMMALPGILAIALALSLGISWLMSACDVMFRDVRHLAPFISQLWFYLSPVIYLSTLVTGPWKPFYRLNPLATIIDGVRWSVLGTAAPGLLAISFCVLSTVLVLAVGLYAFRYAERHLDEVV
jgi:lipopolysaccharide transport system permease protein